MQIIKIDPVRAQAPQGFMTGALECFRSAIDDTLAFDSGHTAFAREHDALSERSERFTKQFLVAAKAVQRRGVKVGDASLERRAQQSLRHFERRRRAIR